jgi:copper homeostasis protein
MDRPLLEVCVDTLDGCRAAADAGADRLELCAALELGGLTPSAGFLERARALTDLPLMVMIRPRRGDFLYATEELAAMQLDIERARAVGARGVVLGVLARDGTVDLARARALVAAARPLEVTFHRAFDLARDLDAALDALLELGVERVLTSGGAADVVAGTPVRARLVARAAGRLGVLAGGGVRPENARALVAATGVREVHASCGVLRASGMAFANAACDLGGAHLPGEYERRATDGAVVRALRTALSR